MASRLTRDPKIVIHGNSCIILYIIDFFFLSILRLELNSTNLEYYTELDAAVLFGVKPSASPNAALPGKSSSVDPPQFNKPTVNSESDHQSAHSGESVVEGLSRLHLRDGLSAALEESDNGYFDMLPVRIQHLW